MRPGPLQLTALPPLTLYIHLPWCLRKCPYCDFNSHEWRATSTAEADGMPESAYIDALIADLDAALPLIWGRGVQAIFIGGGTPSLFSPQAIDRLLGDVRARASSSRPTARSRSRLTPAPSSATASAPTARPASPGCRWACRASTTST
jgi:coproporphyrinogen III oxidase-like Fe-S oxidoreductase